MLAQVPGPLIVISLAGLYRTGKSFILNKLAGGATTEKQGKAFAVGSSIGELLFRLGTWPAAQQWRAKR
jgi:hypothetical protein